MKLMYGSVPVKSLNVHHFEMDTNSATVVPSDLQAGVTCYARGQKVTGTGKCFSFAFYGDVQANEPWFIPSDFNVIEITCTEHPVQHIIPLKNMKDIDFVVTQNVATAIVDNNSYPITVNFADNMLNINCEQSMTFQVFCGKDEYI